MPVNVLKLGVSSRLYWRSVRIFGTRLNILKCWTRFPPSRRQFNFKVNPFVLSWEIREKDKFSLSLVKHHCFKVYKGMVIQQRVLLPWALDGGLWSASRLGFLSPGETDTGARWIGSWVDPRASLDAMGVRPRFLVRDVDIKCDVPRRMQVVVYCRYVSTSYSRANIHFVLR